MHSACMSVYVTYAPESMPGQRQVRDACESLLIAIHTYHASMPVNKNSPSVIYIIIEKNAHAPRIWNVLMEEKS